MSHVFAHQSDFFSILQGLYPGYMIFFVQSALMINGSKGNSHDISEMYLIESYVSLQSDWPPLCIQLYTDGNKL
jgi:hypothetical protein